MQREVWLDETHIEVFLNEFLKSLLFRYQKRVYRTNQMFLLYSEGTLERSETSASFAKLA